MDISHVLNVIKLSYACFILISTIFWLVSDDINAHVFIRIIKLFLKPIALIQSVLIFVTMLIVTFSALDGVNTVLRFLIVDTMAITSIIIHFKITKLIGNFIKFIFNKIMFTNKEIII